MAIYRIKDEENKSKQVLKFVTNSAGYCRKFTSNTIVFNTEKEIKSVTHDMGTIVTVLDDNSIDMVSTISSDKKQYSFVFKSNIEASKSVSDPKENQSLSESMYMYDGNHTITFVITYNDDTTEIKQVPIKRIFPKEEYIYSTTVTGSVGLSPTYWFDLDSYQLFPIIEYTSPISGGGIQPVPFGAPNTSDSSDSSNDNDNALENFGPGIDPIDIGNKDTDKSTDSSTLYEEGTADGAIDDSNRAPANPIDDEPMTNPSNSVVWTTEITSLNLGDKISFTKREYKPVSKKLYTMLFEMVKTSATTKLINAIDTLFDTNIKDEDGLRNPIYNGIKEDWKDKSIWWPYEQIKALDVDSLLLGVYNI